MVSVSQVVPTLSSAFILILGAGTFITIVFNLALPGAATLYWGWPDLEYVIAGVLALG
ncbi:hypothetical protein BGZ95_005924, partial [Linnemannia exigua]